MCSPQKKQAPTVELADIFLKHGDAYTQQHGVSAAQHKAIKAISHCRTAVLGGHVSRCNHCDAEEISYNSCRYRACPKCQKTKQMRWLEARKAELLPTHYFHVVFTIPHELNGIASYNPKLVYSLLFKAAWLTIHTLGQDKKRLGGLMGMLAFLHTWGQTLTQHIHLHCMIPGGALCSRNGLKHWKASTSTYLFPHRVMSKLFGKYFITLLRQAYTEKAFVFKGQLEALSDPIRFESLMHTLSKKSWNVYAKEPFNGAEGGLEYLSAYVSKTAISNERIVSCTEGKVSFKWRDYANKSQSKIMSLDVHEFIRRFLIHVVPDGFMRIRAFGFLANACKAKNTAIIKRLLGAIQEELSVLGHEIVKETIEALVLRITGVDIGLCKRCRIGRLEVVHTIKPGIAWNDTS